MSGELPHALVAVGRGSGLAGVLAAAAGLTAVTTVGLPWHEAAAELTMLGAAEDRAVVALLGTRTAAGVLAAVVGLVAAGLGVALAVDRHPGWTRRGLLTTAGVLTVCGLVPWVWRPPLDRFPDESGALADLRAVVDELPVGVELALSVRAGLGASLSLAAGIAVVVAVCAARDLDAR